LDDRNGRESEIEHLNDAVGRDHNVGRLQVAMRYALVMGRLQRFEDLPGILQRSVDRLRNGQRGAIDQLHHQGAHRSVFLDAINMRDIWMIERRQDLCLALKSHHALGIMRESGGQDFDRYVTIELGVSGAVHLSHAAGVDGREQFVGTYTSFRGQWHRLSNGCNVAA
jgi:hypothetical protein